MEFLRSCYTVIVRDILLGGAYKTIGKGLWVTVEIAALGMLFGLILGALLCAMMNSRSAPLRGMGKTYTAVVRGAPVPLLLSLLYYVVFARTSLAAITIAVIGFALNSAAYFGENMRVSLMAVDPMQISAARTLGFSAAGAFFHVALPRALRVAKPLMQSTVISIIQWTSVVGTISIADLTRTVEDMGTRTAQPFVALAMGILLYLALTGLVSLLFRLGEGAKR